MVKQYRLERYNGIEWLVCEIYFKHTWNKQENDAYAKFLDEGNDATRQDFGYLLEHWLRDSHSPDDTFYGLSEPIPVVETIPHLVMRGAIVNNRIASLNVDYMDSVTPQVVLDSISGFYGFVRSPHWRSSISNMIDRYGSLFGTSEDS